MYEVNESLLLDLKVVMRRIDWLQAKENKTEAELEEYRTLMKERTKILIKKIEVNGYTYDIDLLH